MNLKRGLFRLWLVVSVLFGAAVVVYSVPSIIEEFSLPASFDQGRVDLDPDIRMLRDAGVWVPYAMLGRMAAIAIGVPIGVFLLGSALFWAASGFKRGRSSN